MFINSIAKKIWLLVFFVFIWLFGVKAEDLAIAPENVQAALFLKILAFNTKLTGDITIYVIGSKDFADEMKKGIGKSIGSGKLSNVVSGEELPTEKPSIIYVSDKSKLDEVIKYSYENKVLSITGNPNFVKEGITLGVGVAGGKPKVVLNLNSSKEEDINWNPAILKIALVIKK